VAFTGVCVLAVVGFALLPWSLEGKALAALHGLCAQQPSHSFYFGDARLPFDARMTGIYGGFAVTLSALVARGRWRSGGVLSLRVAACLVLFVGLLGFDGLNSTLRDLGLRHAYAPVNGLRLVTGALTGVSLAVFIVMLVSQVAFRRDARRAGAPVGSMRDLGALLIPVVVYVAIVLTAWGPLRIPLTLLLMASAVTAVAGLALGFVILLARREGRATTTRELAGPATVALIAALAIIGMLGGSRFLLEAWLNIEPAVRSAA
jgi:uncharacterized membrane protein